MELVELVCFLVILLLNKLR